jgi:hypothetical protein
MIIYLMLLAGLWAFCFTRWFTEPCLSTDPISSDSSSRSHPASTTSRLTNHQVGSHFFLSFFFLSFYCLVGFYFVSHFSLFFFHRFLFVRDHRAGTFVKLLRLWFVTCCSSIRPSGPTSRTFAPTGIKYDHHLVKQFLFLLGFFWVYNGIFYILTKVGQRRLRRILFGSRGRISQPDARPARFTPVAGSATGVNRHGRRQRQNGSTDLNCKFQIHNLHPHVRKQSIQLLEENNKL